MLLATLDVEPGPGEELEVALGAEVDTVIVMSTDLQRLSVNAIVSLYRQTNQLCWKFETYFVDPPGYSSFQRREGANL